MHEPSTVDLIRQTAAHALQAAERLLPEIADQIDIIGYNLEHDPTYPADEQSDPVQSAKRMRDAL